RFPACAKRVAKAATNVVLPTPPLPVTNRKRLARKSSTELASAGPAAGKLEDSVADTREFSTAVGMDGVEAVLMTRFPRSRNKAFRGPMRSAVSALSLAA